MSNKLKTLFESMKVNADPHTSSSSSQSHQNFNSDPIDPNPNPINPKPNTMEPNPNPVNPIPLLIPNLNPIPTMNVIQNLSKSSVQALKDYYNQCFQTGQEPNIPRLLGEQISNQLHYRIYSIINQATNAPLYTTEEATQWRTWSPTKLLHALEAIVVVRPMHSVNITIMDEIKNTLVISNVDDKVVPQIGNDLTSVFCLWQLESLQAVDTTQAQAIIDIIIQKLSQARPPWSAIAEQLHRERIIPNKPREIEDALFILTERFIKV